MKSRPAGSAQMGMGELCFYLRSSTKHHLKENLFSVFQSKSNDLFKLCQLCGEAEQSPYSKVEQWILESWTVDISYMYILL